MNEDVMTQDAVAVSLLRSAWDMTRVFFGLGLLGVMGLLWSLLAVPLYYLLPRRAGLVVGRWLIHTAFRVYLRTLSLIGACRFDLSALDALRDQPPMIVAPNHPSLIDAVLVISRLPGLACIMKSSIVDNPSLGAGARLARYIRNDALRSMIHLAVADLRAGHHLLLFPEGTRSTARPIGPIRGSVALIAKQAQVPVQTVFIETDSPFLAKGWPLLRRPQLPITYRVRLGKRFDPPTDAQAFVTEIDTYFREAWAGATLPEPLAASSRDDGSTV
ncbi:MAG: 1-acyl-sn-glycerol-3-phosphate acyltransferase [Burkholderiaceae bacterium]|jgi:1-acyl-sn-glycerol-3-phosphate acyltransferase|nr:1-acyl-sn-glycerol-3-phosphate acyltransferase [Burkholderiaceae bacterium]